MKETHFVMKFVAKWRKRTTEERYKGEGGDKKEEDEDGGREEEKRRGEEFSQIGRIQTKSGHLKCLLTYQNRPLESRINSRRSIIFKNSLKEKSRQIRRRKRRKGDFYSQSDANQFFFTLRHNKSSCCRSYLYLKNKNGNNNNNIIINNNNNSFEKQRLEMEKRRKKRRRKETSLKADENRIVKKVKEFNNHIKSLSNIVRLNYYKNRKYKDEEEDEKFRTNILRNKQTTQQMKSKALRSSNSIVLLTLLLSIGCLPLKFAHSLISTTATTNLIQPPSGLNLNSSGLTRNEKTSLRFSRLNKLNDEHLNQLDYTNTNPLTFDLNLTLSNKQQQHYLLTTLNNKDNSISSDSNSNINNHIKLNKLSLGANTSFIAQQNMVSSKERERELVWTDNNNKNNTVNNDMKLPGLADSAGLDSVLRAQVKDESLGFIMMETKNGVEEEEDDDDLDDDDDEEGGEYKVVLGDIKWAKNDDNMRDLHGFSGWLDYDDDDENERGHKTFKQASSNEQLTESSSSSSGFKRLSKDYINGKGKGKIKGGNWLAVGAPTITRVPTTTTITTTKTAKDEKGKDSEVKKEKEEEEEEEEEEGDENGKESEMEMGIETRNQKRTRADHTSKIKKEEEEMMGKQQRESKSRRIKREQQQQQRREDPKGKESESKRYEQQEEEQKQKQEKEGETFLGSETVFEKVKAEYKADSGERIHEPLPIGVDVLGVKRSSIEEGRISGGGKSELAAVTAPRKVNPVKVKEKEKAKVEVEVEEKERKRKRKIEPPVVVVGGGGGEAKQRLDDSMLSISSANSDKLDRLDGSIVNDGNGGVAAVVVESTTVTTTTTKSDLGIRIESADEAYNESQSVSSTGFAIPSYTSDSESDLVSVSASASASESLRGASDSGLGSDLGYSPLLSSDLDEEEEVDEEREEEEEETEESDDSNGNGNNSGGSSSNDNNDDDDDYNDYGAYVIYDITGRGNSSSNSISNSYLKASSYSPLLPLPLSPTLIATSSASSSTSSLSSSSSSSTTTSSSSSTSTFLASSIANSSSSLSSTTATTTTAVSPFQVIFFAAMAPSKSAAKSTAGSQVATNLVKQKEKGKGREKFSTTLPSSSSSLNYSPPFKRKLNFSKDLPPIQQTALALSTKSTTKVNQKVPLRSEVESINREGKGEEDDNDNNNNNTDGNKNKKRNKNRRRNKNKIKTMSTSATTQSKLVSYDRNKTYRQLKLANDRLFKIEQACQEKEKSGERDERVLEKEVSSSAPIRELNDPFSVHSNSPSTAAPTTTRTTIEIKSETKRRRDTAQIAPISTPSKMFPTSGSGKLNETLAAAAPVGSHLTPTLDYLKKSGDQQQREKVFFVDDLSFNNSLKWQQSKNNTTATSDRPFKASSIQVIQKQQQQRSNNLGEGKVGLREGEDRSERSEKGKGELNYDELGSTRGRGLLKEKGTNKVSTQAAAAGNPQLDEPHRQSQFLARRARNENEGQASHSSLNDKHNIEPTASKIIQYSRETNPRLTEEDNDNKGDTIYKGTAYDEPQLAEDDVKWLNKMSESGSSSLSLPSSSPSSVNIKMPFNPQPERSQFEQQQQHQTGDSGQGISMSKKKINNNNNVVSLNDDYDNSLERKDETTTTAAAVETSNTNQISNQEASFISSSLARLSAFLFGERQEEGKDQEEEDGSNKKNVSKVSSQTKFVSALNNKKNNNNNKLVSLANQKHLNDGHQNEDDLEIMVRNWPTQANKQQQQHSKLDGQVGVIVGGESETETTSKQDNDHNNNTFVMSYGRRENVNSDDKSNNNSNNNNKRSNSIIQPVISGYNSNNNNNERQIDKSSNKNIDTSNNNSLQQRHLATYINNNNYNNTTLFENINLTSFKATTTRFEQQQAGHNVYYWRLIWFILPIGATFGNLLVIMAVYMERSLQSVTNYFIVSLAFADLFVGLIVMPFAVYVLVNEVWELSDAICDIYVAVDVTCSTASILNLVAISIDRYRAVAHPISYSARSSSTRAIITIFAVWLISCCVGAPIILGLNTSPERESTLCILYNSTFIFWSSLTSFYAPCIIMIGLYWRIFSAIRSRTKKAIGSTGDQTNQNQQQQQQQQHHLHQQKPNNHHNNCQHQQNFPTVSGAAAAAAANTNANTITLNINHGNDNTANISSNLDNKSIEQQQNNLNDQTNGSKEKQDNSSSSTIAQATTSAQQTTNTFPAQTRDDMCSNKLTSNNDHLMIDNKKVNKKQENVVSLSAQLDRTTTSGRLFSDTTSYSDATFADLPSFVAPSRELTTFQDDVSSTDFVENETGNQSNSCLQANNKIKLTTIPISCSRKPVATNINHDDKQSDLNILLDDDKESSATFQSNQAPTIQVRLPQQHSTPPKAANSTSSQADQTNSNKSSLPTCPMFIFSKRLEDSERSSFQRLLKALSSHISSSSSSSNELATDSDQTSMKACSQKISNENRQQQQSNIFKFAFERLQKQCYLLSSKEKSSQQQQHENSCYQSELLTSQILQFLPSKQATSISQDIYGDLMNVCLLFMISKADSLKSAYIRATSSPSTSSQPNLRKVCLQLNEYKDDGVDNDSVVVVKKGEQDRCFSSSNDKLDTNCIKAIKERLNQLNESAEILLSSKCVINNLSPTNKTTKIIRSENKTCCACCGQNKLTTDQDIDEVFNRPSTNLSICLSEPVVEEEAQLIRLTMISINSKDQIISSNATQFLSANNQLSSKTMGRFVIWSSNLIHKQQYKPSVDETQSLHFEFSKLIQSGQKLCKDCRISCSLCSIVYGNTSRNNRNSDILVNPKKMTVRSVSANVTPNKSSSVTLAATKQQVIKQKSERELECIHLSRLLKEEHKSKLSICGQIEANSGGISVGVGDGVLRKSYSDLSESEQDLSSQSSTTSYRHGGGFNYTCESRSNSASSGSITGYDCSVSHINDSQRSSRNSWSRRSCCQALTNCATCERLMITSSQNYYNQQRQQAGFNRNNISTSSLVCTTTTATTTTTNGNNIDATCANSNGNLVEQQQQQLQQIDKVQITPFKKDSNKKGNCLNYIYDDYDDNDDISAAAAAANDDNDDEENHDHCHGKSGRKETSNEIGGDKGQAVTKSRWFRGSNQSDAPICECISMESDTSKSNRQVAERSQAELSQRQLQIHQQQCKHYNQYQHRNDCSSRSHSINVSVVTNSITDHTTNNCTCPMSDNSSSNNNSNNKSPSKFRRIRGNSENCVLGGDICDCKRHNRDHHQQQPKLSCQHAAGVLQNATEKIKRRSIRLGQLIRGKNANQKQIISLEQQQQQKQHSNSLVPNSHINSDESRFSTTNTATINAKSSGTTTTTSSGQQTTSLRAGTLLTEETTHMNSPSYIDESNKLNKLQHLSIELAPNHSSKYLLDKCNEIATLKSNCLAIDSATIAQSNDRDSNQANNLDDNKQGGFFASLIQFMHPLPKTKLQLANSNSRYNSTRSTPTLAKDINNAIRHRTGSRKRREKNAAKRERKATKTLAIVLGVFLICWTPFFTCNIIDGICIQLNIDCRPGMMVYLVTSWLGYINSCVNPIIYTIFNMEFRRAFKKILTTSPACFNG